MARPRTPKGRAREVARRLAAEYPDAVCELDHRSPWELLVATILSAQTTDVRVNMVTPELFRRYPTAADLATADPEEVATLIRSTGFYQNKTRSILGMANAVEERFGGEVPSRLEDLVTLPGVGRKTANVVRSVALDLPGLPVDTHVGRLSRRLGMTEHDDPVKVELDLNRYLPRRRARALQPADDPTRPSCVPGQVAALRGVCARGHLPVEQAAVPATDGRVRHPSDVVPRPPARWEVPTERADLWSFRRHFPATACPASGGEVLRWVPHNQDPATWVAATRGSAARCRPNDGLVRGRRSRWGGSSPKSGGCGDLDGSTHRPLGNAERTLCLVDGRDEVFAVTADATRQGGHPLSIGADRLGGRAQFGGDRRSHRCATGVVVENLIGKPFHAGVIVANRGPAAP